MRLLISTFALGLTLSLAFGQKLQGTYHPAGHGEVSWQINNHETLIWNGQPYMPVGVEVQPDPKAIATVKAAGISDVVVDLPAADVGWGEAISALEQSKLNYLIRISSLAPMATGVVVDPAAYRVTQLTQPLTHLDISMPGATEALVLVALKRDASVITFNRVPVVNGKLTTDIKVPAGLETVVLLYPTAISLAQPDYWENLDDHRDRLLSAIRRNPTGPGLRGFVNPLGKTVNLPGRELRFVPNSPAFRAEFAEFLQSRYRNTLSVLQAWSLGSTSFFTPDADPSKDGSGSFDDLAMLVPLWSGTRGVPQIWDPKRNKIYPVDARHSAYWKDLSDMINVAASRRFQRLVDSIHSVADVPVVQEWAGWAAPYEGQVPSIDGIGMRATGTTPSALTASASRATSSILRWKTSGWLPATDIDLSTPDATTQLSAILDDLQSLGARTFFCRADTPALLKAVAGEATRRGSDTSASQYSPLPVFFPENAANPAVAERLPGGRWWLPSPADGDRIDYGSGFYGYRIADPSGTKIAIWAKTPRKALLRMASVSPKLTLTSTDGTQLLAKASKKGLEVDLTEFPLIISGIDSLPVPQLAFDNTVAQFAQLLKDGETTHREQTEEAVELANALDGFDRNPGGVYPELRQTLHELAAKTTDFTWVEAESSADNDFSEVLVSPGCSGGRALSLHSAVASPGGFYTTYDLPVHSNLDQDIWIAAKVSPEQKGDVVVRLGSQSFTLSENPIGLYGAGYGWYHLGVTKLLGNYAQMRIQVTQGGDDLALDAILMCPSSFKPNGVDYPEFAVTMTQKKRQGRRGRNGGG